MEKLRRPSIKQNMPIGIRLRMRELKMRVPDLGEKIQTPPSTLYKILGGRSEPTLGLAVKIAWGLGWALEKFVSEYYTHDPIAEIAQLGRIASAEGEKGCKYSLPLASGF